MDIRRMMRAISAGVALAALSISASARAEWWQAETSHFIVYSESKKADAEQFARLLERYDNALRYLQGRPVPGPDMGVANKVKVFRSGDTDDIAALAGAPESGIYGFYIGRAGGTVAFVPARNKRRDGVGVRTLNEIQLDTQRVLFHEYTHHFMLTNFSTAYPHWYSEGFAEVYGTIELRDDGSFHLGNVPQARGEALRVLPDTRLSRLFDHKVKLKGMELMQSYSVGWLLSHYLNFSEARKGQLPAYLTALNKGEDSLEAAKRVFGDLDKLQAELRKYKNGPFPGYDIKPPAYVEPVVTTRQLTAVEESLMPPYIRSQVGVNPKQAKDVARDVAGKDSANPDSLFAQLVVAEAQLDAKNFDAAETAAKRAIAIAPTSSPAHFMMGAVHMARGETDKAQYAAARPWFTKAHTLDLKDPRPMIGLYMSYSEAGGPIPEEALIMLEDAWDYASYDPGYRLVLARQLLNENKGKLARDVLSPIAFDAHAGDKENKILATVEFIDQDKINEARGKIAEIFQDQKDAAAGKKKG
ncbi:tetratricopeptide (TPR) repeat protein [Sphingopyxis panaciterrae]|uniref:tetratricopeptide repeat protein n=1 Tax=Sphingopyxis panaciterrae TaxID=363841 RepID=UPI00142120B5|nr:hypothetical protein [Sphingopyxis panaciterrae]NIJ39136.1 tetratricopeptide (TPR) repeat protein [Sphingopyxis panaciterrae]